MKTASLETTLAARERLQHQSDHAVGMELQGDDQYSLLVLVPDEEAAEKALSEFEGITVGAVVVAGVPS